MRRRYGTCDERDAVLDFGSLRVDRRRRGARLDGVERQSRGRQFALLEVLAANAGRILGRDEISDLTGRCEWAALDRSVGVQVCRIRAAIEDEPRIPRRLVTTRGLRYLFACRPDTPA